MKIIDLLKHFLKVGEIHARIDKKQIKINGVAINRDNLSDDINVMDGYWEYSEFVFDWYKDTKPTGSLILRGGCSIRDFFGSEPTNIDIMRFFTGFDLVSLSKKEEYVFMIK